MQALSESEWSGAASEARPVAAGSAPEEPFLPGSLLVIFLGLPTASQPGQGLLSPWSMTAGLGEQEAGLEPPSLGPTSSSVPQEVGMWARGCHQTP